jgi:hypothetical protein
VLRTLGLRALMSQELLAELAVVSVATTEALEAGAETSAEQDASGKCSQLWSNPGRIVVQGPKILAV